VVTRADLPTTSGKPRYALEAGFAALFAPELSGLALDEAVLGWQSGHLSTGALARVALHRRGADFGTEGVPVSFPNGETRRLAPGPSSEISRAVIETFGPRFLLDPVVLWLGESDNKVVARDDDLASASGLKIETDRNRPTIVLLDSGPPEPLVLFVEVVATDGPINQRQRDALLGLTTEAGFQAARSCPARTASRWTGRSR
jgi:hypothetical protein